MRGEVVDMLMRYLDTDTLLCWSPEPTIAGAVDAHGEAATERETLRALQIKTARPIIHYLTSRVWPGIEIHPVTESNSIVPAPQPQMTRDVIRGWIAGLPPYELAGLERAVLACKGLLGAVRLIVEWSSQFQHLRRDTDAEERKSPSPQRFGIEEAAAAASVEVRWQTDMWGEVEDTHDVEREDLRRQLGSVVLLVSEEGV